MFTLKKLDSGEKLILGGLLITFLLDVISTVYAIIKNKHFMESNLIIAYFGWYAFPFVLLLNLITIWFIMKLLQKYREKIIERFDIICLATLVTLARTYVIGNNFVVINSNVTSNPTIELLPFWFVVIIIFLILIALYRLPFYIFRKNMEIKYKG